MAHHKIKTHRWKNGQLISNEFEFETFEDALAFSGQIGIDTAVKIYNSDGQVIHEAGSHNVDTYA